MFSILAILFLVAPTSESVSKPAASGKERVPWTEACQAITVDRDVSDIEAFNPQSEADSQTMEIELLSESQDGPKQTVARVPRAMTSKVSLCNNERADRSWAEQGPQLILRSGALYISMEPAGTGGTPWRQIACRFVDRFREWYPGTISEADAAAAKAKLERLGDLEFFEERLRFESVFASPGEMESRLYREGVLNVPIRMSVGGLKRVSAIARGDTTVYVLRTSANADPHGTVIYVFKGGRFQYYVMLSALGHAKGQPDRVEEAEPAFRSVCRSVFDYALAGEEKN